MKNLLKYSAILLVTSHCQDFTSPAYIEKPASEKHDMLWQAVNSDRESHPWYSVFNTAGVLIYSMDPVLNHPGDAMR